MHEFSLAQNIIEIAEEQAKKYLKNQISEIIIEIGQLSGVETEALDFALQSLKISTILEKANIRLDLLKASAKCKLCGTVFMPEDFFQPCPTCGLTDSEIIKGRELKVKSITF